MPRSERRLSSVRPEQSPCKRPVVGSNPTGGSLNLSNEMPIHAGRGNLTLGWGSPPRLRVTHG